MKNFIKTTKVPATNTMRMKPAAAPVRIAVEGDKIELRTAVHKKKTARKKVKKASKGTSCGCGGTKFQAGGSMAVTSPMNPKPKAQPLNTLRVNQLKQPSTGTMNPSAPRTIKDTLPPKPTGYNNSLLPGQKEIARRSVMGSVAKLMMQRRNKARMNKQQLNKLSTPFNPSTL